MTAATAAHGAQAEPGAEGTELITSRRSALRDPEFLRYLAGQTVSRFGDQLWFIALSWTAVRLGSPAMAGVLLMLSAVPRLVLLLFVGVIADRFSIRALTRLRPQRGLGRQAAGGLRASIRNRTLVATNGPSDAMRSCRASSRSR